MIPRKKLEKFYIKEGLSASVIAQNLKCSEHKVNYWLTKYGIPKRSISDAMYLKYNPGGDPFMVCSPRTLEEAQLLGLGIGLYWGEGNKKNKYSVRLGNTDPRLIKKFIEFLEKICGIRYKKLKFGLQIFSDMSEREALLFWQREINISLSQFMKVVVTPTGGVGTYKNKSRYGVLTVHFHNRKLRDIICKMIEEL